MQGNDKNQSNYEMEARASAKATNLEGDASADKKFLENRSEGAIFPMKDETSGKVFLYVKFEGKTYNTSTGVAID